MGENHIRGLQAGILKTNDPPFTNDVDLLPWPGGALGAWLHADAGAGAGRAQPRQRDLGRPFQHLLLARPEARGAGVIMTQILPFADHKAVALYGAFERGVYAAIGEV